MVGFWRSFVDAAKRGVKPEVEVRILGSGSRGNAMLVGGEQGQVLIDCGFSKRNLKQRLEQAGESLGNIRAVLVTHEHGDHAQGALAVARACQVPLYATRGTAERAGWLGAAPLRVLSSGAKLKLAGMDIQSYVVPHDAAEPVQFVCTQGQRRVGVLSDAGHVTAHMCATLHSCDALFIEANHCLDMLAQGPYPPSLKARVGGRFGHLNNTQTAQLLERVDLARVHSIVLTHISEQNNCPDRAQAVVRQPLSQWNGQLLTASQDQPLAAISV